MWDLAPCPARTDRFFTVNNNGMRRFSVHSAQCRHIEQFATQVQNQLHHLARLQNRQCKSRQKEHLKAGQSVANQKGIVFPNMIEFSFACELWSLASSCAQNGLKTYNLTETRSSCCSRLFDAGLTSASCWCRHGVGG